MEIKKQTPATLRSIVLVLCVALVASGLHSKFSGYTASNHTHPKSVNKLMQDDLTRRIAVSSAPVAHANPFLNSADLVAVYAQPRSIVGRSPQVPKPRPDSAPSQTYALRFRPPPATI
jgi:hypothetical protein